MVWRLDAFKHEQESKRNEHTVMVPNDGRAEGHKNKQGWQSIEQTILFREGLRDDILRHGVKRGNKQKYFRAKRHEAGRFDLNAEEGVEKAQEGVEGSIVEVRIRNLGKCNRIV